MAVSTSGTDWHDTNRGVSLYITVYLSLFSIILVFSVRDIEYFCCACTWACMYAGEGEKEDDHSNTLKRKCPYVV